VEVDQVPIALPIAAVRDVLADDINLFADDRLVSTGRAVALKPMTPE
jgi:hypothetical protein